MEQTLENGIADNLLHNIFNDLSVGLELYDKDGLMIDVNYSRLRSMGIKDNVINETYPLWTRKPVELKDIFYWYLQKKDSYYLE